MVAVEGKKLIPTELQEMYALMAWARITKYRDEVIAEYLMHIANEGRRTMQQGFTLKMAGLMVGVSDYFLAIPACGYSGLWLELKSQHSGRKLTIEQNLFLEKMKRRGYAAYMARGAEQAKKQIREYLGIT